MHVCSVGNVRRIGRKVYRKLGLKLLMPLVFVAIYTLLGGALFRWTEYANDVQMKTHAKQEWLQRRASFLMTLDNLPEDG
jgi:hypothetical protein